METKTFATYLIFLSLSLVSTDSLFAQASGGGGGGGSGGNNGEELGIRGFWEIELEGGRFLAKLSTITSISQHQYIVDGAARVYEVTVDTSGSQTARFYFIEAVGEGSPLSIGKDAIDRLKSVAQGATARAGVDEVWTQVVKNYPTTTHSRTAEFRVDNKALLDKIYQHVHKVWAREKGSGKSNKLRIVSKKN